METEELSHSSGFLLLKYYRVTVSLIALQVLTRTSPKQYHL
jgi:hypothetical protein